MRRPLLRLLRVAGRSMSPTLDDGDYVLVTAYSRTRPPRPGDVACIAREGSPTLIKRLGTCSPGGLFPLSGDGAASAPACDLGLAGMADLLGRAILRLNGNRLSILPRKTARPGTGADASGLHL